MKAMILAAGMGSRLGGLTKDIPKPMLDVNGRPILEYILVNLVRHGFNKVFINLFHRAEVIMNHFGDGSPWGADIAYIRESQLLGTAGSVKNAVACLQGEAPFLVHYGDVLTDQDYTAMLEFHRFRQAQTTLLLHQRVGSNSVVALDEESRVTALLERPDEHARRSVQSPWVNSGVYLFQPSILEDIPTGLVCDFPRDIFPGLLARRRIYGYALTGYRCAIDSAARLEKARLDLQELAWPGLR